jgi:23S rRNA (adenine2503-C2)-methyltransferase
MEKTNILKLDYEGLKSFMAGMDMPLYRADQVARWVYDLGLTSFDGMTNIKRADREKLGENAEIKGLPLIKRQVSTDGTEKYLFLLDDGEKIESVLIPDEDRLTLCISSQAGCALGCRFCLTGAGGYRRDLLPHEITGQVLAVKHFSPHPSPSPRVITNIVLMGMGEPLMNQGNVFDALRRLTSERMFGISTRRITLSTAGVVPGIKALGESGIGVNLAVSLNAATDAVRDKIMPINRKYPIAALIAALKAYPLPPRRRITIEYVMLKGINDSLADCKTLIKLIRGLKCKVNLIPFNEHPGSEYKRPDRGAVHAFQEALANAGLSVFIRDSRGADILAACGQLRADAVSEIA